MLGSVVRMQVLIDDLLSYSRVGASDRPFVAVDLGRIAREALEQGRVVNDLTVVGDGEQLLDYLLRRGPYAAEGGRDAPGPDPPRPEMPRVDGREALAAIKSDPDLRRIPIVVLTTTKAEEDIFRSDDLGANSFITKPVTVTGLVQMMNDLGRYGFEIVDLPPDTAGD